MEKEERSTVQTIIINTDVKIEESEEDINRTDDTDILRVPQEPANPDSNKLSLEEEAYTFFSSSSIYDHFLTGRRPKGRPRRLPDLEPRSYDCNQCNRTFALKSSLKRHLVNHVNPFKCLNCGLKFSEVSDYQEHCVKVDCIKPFKCSLCDKGFLKLATLKVHSRTHIELKKHQCPRCGKKFANKFCLERHALKGQNVEKLNCPYCEKTFNRKDNMKRHMEKAHGQTL